MRTGRRLARLLSCLFMVVLVLESVLAISVSAAVGHIKEFAISGKSEAIAVGADGSLWFAENGSPQIARLSTSGRLTEFGVLSGGERGFLGITAGPDGNLWVTETTFNRIGKIDMTGALTEYSIPSGNLPSLIAPGPDGNLWFTEEAASKIGKITTAGAVTELTTLVSGAAPSGIVAGPDGNLWFDEQGVDKIGVVNTAGTLLHEYSLASGATPSDITVGPDGNLWFTEFGHTVNKIGVITTSGTVNDFPVLTASSEPGNIAAGQDGNLWFTEEAGHNGGAIGRITTGGSVTEFDSLTAGSGPGGITAGPDGNIWFTERLIRQIGRLTDAASGIRYEQDRAFGFVYKSLTVPQGTNVQWTFFGPSGASATDTSGMGLFDSGARSFVSLYSFTFIAAGSYPYDDIQNLAHQGTIKVPVLASPASGGTSTIFTITWASIGPPSGFVFDVQITRPGAASFVNWKLNQTATSANFVADSGTGTYSFRSRLRKVAGGKHSGWSPIASIAVS